MLVTVGAVYDAADFQGLFVFYTALEKCVIHLQLFALRNLDENSRRKKLLLNLAVTDGGREIVATVKRIQVGTFSVLLMSYYENTER